MPDTTYSPKSDLVWHVVAVALVTLIPAQIYFGRPVYLAPETHRFVLGGLAAAYTVAAAALVGIAWRRGSRPTVLESVTTAGAAFGVLCLLLMLRPSDYSRGVVLLSTALSLALIAVPSLLFTWGGRARRGAMLCATVLLFAAGVTGALTRNALEGRPLLGRVLAELAEASSSRSLTPSMLYNLEITTLQNHFDNPIPGGGIAPIGPGLLVMGGDGSAWFVADLQADPLAPRPLAIRAPQNREAYESREGGPVPPTFFRVTDILVLPVQGEGEALDLFVVHSYWNDDESCGSMRVSASRWDTPGSLVEATAAEWRTLFEAAPCTALESENQGGRLVALDESTLLLSLGDFDFDGVKNPERYGQDSGVDYGKTILIDRASGNSRTYTSGHRNPQGLFASSSGRVWATEHGPRGGDELNLLVDGANYGWPMATYGTAYFQWEWPMSTNPGSHAGFEAPFYSWLPSIGVSSLTAIERDRFPAWSGDLIVGSLREQSLWRVRVRRSSTAYVERIPVGVRVRDIMEAPDGRLVIWSDAGDLVLVDQAGSGSGGAPSIESGAATFAANCSECHSIDRSRGTTAGPDLFAVLGRAIAGDPAYAYSPALGAMEGIWTRELLADFLREPTAFAEGTRMAIPGMRDEAAIEALLLHLETLR